MKATLVPRKSVLKEQDYNHRNYHNMNTENLMVRWTPGHRDLRNATTYQDYVDIHGNKDLDTSANMGDNLSMDMPRPLHTTWYFTDISCQVRGSHV